MPWRPTKCRKYVYRIRAPPTETKVESGTSQRKRGTSFDSVIVEIRSPKPEAFEYENLVRVVGSRYMLEAEFIITEVLRSPHPYHFDRYGEPNQYKITTQLSQKLLLTLRISGGYVTIPGTEHSEEQNPILRIWRPR